MILDNADDGEVLLRNASSDASDSGASSSTRPLISFVPQAIHGRVLVTTRNKTVATELVADFFRPIHVKELNRAESIQLLKNKLMNAEVVVDAEQEEDASQLVEALDYIPLAITQAGAHIRNASHLTLQGYLSIFCKNNATQIKFLSKEAHDLRRDPDVPNAVMSTWEISFAQIRRQSPTAADLLSLMCLFHRQGIPDSLLIHEPDSNGPFSAAEEEDEFEFREAIALLVNFSLIRTDSEWNYFEMHRLVQIVTRNWLESNCAINQYHAKALKKIAGIFPYGEYEKWEECAALLPHAEEIINGGLQTQESDLSRALLLSNTASYHDQKGNHPLARDLGLECLEIRRKWLNEDDSSILESIAELGFYYNQNHQFDEAEKLLSQCVATFQISQDEEHPQALSSRQQLGYAYHRQGKFRLAEEIWTQLLEVQKKDPEHVDTLRTMMLLAAPYRDQGRYNKAETLALKVLKERQRVFGEEHPLTLKPMNDLAMIYLDQARYEKAETLQLEVLRVEERIFGKEHPNTLAIMNNLALTYLNQARYSKAETLNLKVLEIRKRVSSDEHPNTLMTMQNLASTYSDQVRHEEAESLKLQVLSSTKRVLSDEHPNTLFAMNSLALTYSYQARYEEAETLQVQVLKTKKKVFGDEHRDTLIAMNNLACTWKDQYRDVEALALMSECAELREKVLGRDHPHTAGSRKWVEIWKRKEESNDMSTE